MAEDLPIGPVLAERARAQRLVGPRPASATQVVRAVGSLQAQDPRALPLAIRARGEGLDIAAVRQAFGGPGRLLITWLMRGTLHAVPAEDAGWLVDLFRPPRSAGRTRRLRLGLDDGLLDRALPVVGELLAAGPLTRSEVVARLGERGVQFGGGQAPAHLLHVAAREGVLCRGPDRDGEPTYVPLATWAAAGDRIDRDEALTRLARRYLTGHGPAGAGDLAAWSGLSLGDARRGLSALGDEVESVRIGGQPAYRPVSTSPTGSYGPTGSDGSTGDDWTVRLVPAFDEYLLGYRGRELAVDRRHATRIQAGGGIIHPAVLVAGRIVGTWRQRRAAGRLTLTVEPFGRLAPGTRSALDVEAADIGRFLGLDTTLTLR